MFHAWLEIVPFAIGILVSAGLTHICEGDIVEAPCADCEIEIEEEASAAAISLLQTQIPLGNRFTQTKKEIKVDDLSLTEKLSYAKDLFHIIPTMVAAFRLKLFDVIPTEGGATFQEIVERTRTSRKGMDALLDALVALGAIKYSREEERFYNEFRKVAPFDEEKWTIEQFGWSVSMQRQLFYLEDSVREGKAVGLTSVFGDYESLYEVRADMPDVAKDWDPFMDSFDNTIVKDIQFVYQMPTVVNRIGKGSRSFEGRVLDWCGNTGKNSIRLAQSDPTMHLTVLDLPEQVSKATERIKAAGLQSQIDTLGMDLLSEDQIQCEEKYDAVFMFHMVREWTQPSMARFFNMIYPILNPGGIVLIGPAASHEIGKDYGNKSISVSIFPLYFLASASHQERPKTHDDIKRLLTAAGFVDPKSTAEAWLTAVKP